MRNRLGIDTSFDFRSDAPGVDVRYVEPPITQDASGRKVDVRGTAFLQVRMEPASGVDLSLTIHPHPTFGEGVMEAAKAALGQAIHVANR